MKAYSSSGPQLQIFNPQPFTVTVVIQNRETGRANVNHISYKQSWNVPGPGPEGMWISFTREYDKKFLAGTLLKEGTTLAQLILDTNLGIVLKQNPEEKLSFGNGLSRKVIVQYELQGTIAMTENLLMPEGLRGSSVVAEQQPSAHSDLWVHFMREDRTTLSTFLASDAISEVVVLGKEKFKVGTPY